MAIDAKQVVELRKMTNAGILECKAALEEAQGDMEKAKDILRKKGAIKAAKKSAEREAKEGIVFAYVHSNRKIGAMLEISCESDFVGKNEEFNNLAHDICMQIVAMNPLYVKPEDIPADVLAKEKEIYRAQLMNEGKNENIIDKILEGKLHKYYEDVCVLKQKFIKNDDITIEELIVQKIAILGEKIELKRFVRFEI